jgi:hypothetical protein
MKKEVKEVKKVRVTKVRRELDQLRTDVSDFYQQLKRRRTVTHSTTPAIAKGPDSKPLSVWPSIWWTSTPTHRPRSGRSKEE